MSADNFYLVRKHPEGGFVALMGFSSDDQEPTVNLRRNYLVFATPEEALNSVVHEYTEYGVSVHPECEEPPAGSVTIPRQVVEVLVHGASDVEVGYAHKVARQALAESSTTAGE